MIPRALLALTWAACLGCQDFGHVNQGQVVELDRGRALVTIVSDSNFADPSHPRFDVLPPATVRLPSDPREIGPLPEPGLLLGIDGEAGQLIVFDPVTRGTRRVPCRVIEHRRDVPRQAQAAAGRSFPLIDLARRTLTLYSPHQRVQATVEIDAGEMARLPETWRAGDMVRYYYRDPAQALRLMNVTRTDPGRGGP